MKVTRALQNIELDNLVLDINNPRFAELYVGDGSEDDLIQYLLENEAGGEVAKAIINAGEFYIDRPLWVLKKDGDYIVKDGNRRCAAVKALQLPGKFGLDLQKINLNKLPALIYDNEEELNNRIFLEHANNTFRSWSRIAQSLEVYRLFKSGTDLKTMTEIDSNPGQLIKLGSFYKSAVIHGGDRLKKLLTKGRGRTGGRTIIFERLFKFSEKCGYKFKNSPTFEIVINDKEKFKLYILSLIKLLESDLEYKIKTDTIDNEKEGFMNRLKIFGFDYFYIPTNVAIQKTDEENNNPSTGNPSGNVSEQETGVNSGSNSEGGNTGSNRNGNLSSNHNNTENDAPLTKPPTTRGSVKTSPTMKRKKIPVGVKNRINECYNLDPIKNHIAKLALVRIAYECTLKYIVENTHYSPKNKLPKSNHFQKAYKDQKGNLLPSTNFEELHKNFIKLIRDKGMQRTFENFKMDQLQQIIHNYNVVGIPQNSISYCAELVPILDFLLADDKDFLNSIDLSSIS
jgi:hypothetical protein